MKTFKDLMQVFRIFQSVESYFDEMENNQSNRLIINEVVVICLFTFIYGVTMGSYHSFIQSMVAGLKVVILFLSTILICFPSFFIIQQVLGSKMSFRQMILIVLSGFVLTSAIALSFAPIVVFFQITGGNYHFLQLLHVSIFTFAGIFGMRLMVDALKYACEKKDIYPQIGVTIFRIWIVILAFVGIQLSWNLRPFLCNKTEEFKWFRKYEGNFYTAIIYSIQQLVSGNETPSKEEDNKMYFYNDSAAMHTSDTLLLKLKDKK
jgi:hypothetical protein